MLNSIGKALHSHIKQYTKFKSRTGVPISITSRQIEGLLQTPNCSSLCFKLTDTQYYYEIFWPYHKWAKEKKWWRIVCQRKKEKCAFERFLWRWTKSMWKISGTYWRRQFRYVCRINLRVRGYMHISTNNTAKMKYSSTTVIALNS